jgi:acylphosphatase
MQTVRLHIIGKVQGVWFRASTKDKARSLGLTGQVWNDPDGSVRAIAQGPDEQLAELVSWCHEGPQLAMVKEVIVKEHPTELIYPAFEITKGRSDD